MSVCVCVSVRVCECVWECVCECVYVCGAGGGRCKYKGRRQKAIVKSTGKT